MYNKSEIMKDAWENFNSGRCATFSEALKLAWYVAKNYVNVAQLKAGDTIEIEYGNYNNFVVCTVNSVSKASFDQYVIIRAISENGLNIEFCEQPTGKIKMVNRGSSTPLAA